VPLGDPPLFIGLACKPLVDLKTLGLLLNVAIEDYAIRDLRRKRHS
jgi:hypothetical protein